MRKYKNTACGYDPGVKTEDDATVTPVAEETPTAPAENASAEGAE